MFTHAEPGTEKLEYRVRKVTRYIVTEWHSYKEASVKGGDSGGSQSYGEFDSAAEAHKVAYALAVQARQENGWAPGDERLVFPTQELVEEQAEEYRRYHAGQGPRPSDL